MNLAPIALFVYNRPDHTKQTVEALLKNGLADASRLFVFSDGPKNDAAFEKVREVREYIRSIKGFRQITIVERKKNHGLANSIISGVTDLCETYGSVIVVEDDLVVSRHFLEYMNEALVRYENEELVMQISGHMYPVDIESESDAIFLPFTTSWGWATWKRAWAGFDPCMSGYAGLKKDRVRRRMFDLEGSYDYFRMLEAQVKGKSDSWAIRWYLSVFTSGGLTLFPKRSLVRNIGFDGSGLHCGVEGGEMASCVHDDFFVQRYPEIGVDEAFRNAVIEYFTAKSGTGNVILKRIARLLR